MKKAEFGGYQLECVFNTITDAQREEVVGFWKQQQALADPNEGMRRASEVCWIARNDKGEIVAVCTLYTDNHGTPPQPHYVFRSFARASDRHAHLSLNMVALVRKTLVEQHQPGQEQQGLVIITENPVLMTPKAKEVFLHWGWTYGGATEHGHDIWRLGYDAMDLELPSEITPH